MYSLAPDIIAELHFLSAEEGGRADRTPENRFGCPLLYSGEYFESLLLLDEVGSISPGETVTLPIVFVTPELVKPRLTVGAKFHLWELRIIAIGTVLEIIETPSAF